MMKCLIYQIKRFDYIVTTNRLKLSDQFFIHKKKKEKLI